MKKELINVLAEKAEQVARSAELIMAKTRDWQMVKEYMCNRLEEDFLTPTQKEKLKRYQFIYNELVTGKHTDKKVATMSSKMFDTSVSQAWEDLNATRELFNSVININKAFELNLALQLNKNYMIKCEEAGDFKMLAKFEKNRIEIIRQLEDTEENGSELFQGHTFEMTFDPSLLGGPVISAKEMKELLDAINAKRNKKINIDMFDEYIDFQHVPNGSETSSE